MTEPSLEPLLTAEQIFPAMESAILSAKKQVYISLHIFSARTRTRSAEAHQLRLQNWGELLAHALKRGVRIRLLLNDFDPVGMADMHASVWERMALLDETLQDLSPEIRHRLKILVAVPGGQSGAMVRLLVWPVVYHMIKKRLDHHRETGRAVPPGLQQFADAKSLLWPPTRNYTQTLHQKFIVIDGTKAIIGGLDIDERRFDGPKHRRTGEETWHDVSVQVGAEHARAIVGHFAQSWRLVRKFGKSFAPAYCAQGEPSALHFIDTQHQRKAISVKREARPIMPVPVTIGQPRPHFLGFGPARRIRALEMAHFDLIAKAERYIYIETQYLRSTAIRDALIARLGEAPNLHIIALLPAAPDDVAYEGAADSVHRYGEWLQMRALSQLRKFFPSRFEAFCKTNEWDREEQGERDALHGKAMVYIHSKLIIADDHHAIVASSNLNGRSMEWDFEAGIYSDDQQFAQDLRNQLWLAHLGESAATAAPVDDPESAMALWRSSAKERKAHGADSAKVGVVPFPYDGISRFSKRHFFIPQQMV